MVVSAYWLDPLEQRSLLSVPVLLADIAVDTSRTHITPLYVKENKLFLKLQKVSGAPSEWWMTDGTPQGSSRIFSSDPSRPVENLTFFEGNVYFTTPSQTKGGDDLWRYDVMAEESLWIRHFDRQPGSSAGGIESMYVAADRLWFTADSATAPELWRIDTDTNTFHLFGTNPPALGSITLGDWVYSVFEPDHYVGGPSTFGRYNLVTNALQVIDHVGVLHSVAVVAGKIAYTDAGQVNLFDPASGEKTELPLIGTRRPFSHSHLTEMGGAIYYASNSPDGIYRTDGTVEGTAQLYEQDILAFDPKLLTATASRLFFVHESKLLVTGWEPGDVQVLLDAGPQPATWGPSKLTAVGDLMFFVVSGASYTSGELWVSDGTPEGTRMLLRPALKGASTMEVDHLVSFNGKLYFNVNDRLYASDGTPEGTAPLDAILPVSDGSAPAQFTPFGRHMLFTARPDRDSQGLYLTNGTAGSAQTLGIFPLDAEGKGVESLVVSGTSIFFTALDDSGRQRLWRSDGASEGTSMLAMPAGAPADSEVVAAAYVDESPMMVVESASAGISIWRVSGNHAESPATLIRSIPGGEANATVTAAGATSTALFVGVRRDGGVRELWVSDGSTDGTMKLGPYAVSDFIALGGLAYFTAGHGMGVSDGTLAGTRVLVEHKGVPGRLSVPMEWATDGSHLYFTAEDGLVGNELYVTEGDGYRVARRFDSSDPKGDPMPPRTLTGGDGAILFGGRDGGTFRFHTASGNDVVQLAIQPPVDRFLPDPLAVARVGDTYYLTLHDEEHGFELWSYQPGSQTTLLADLFPGRADSRIHSLRYHDGKLYIAGENGVTGVEVYALAVPAPPDDPPSQDPSANRPAVVSVPATKTLRFGQTLKIRATAKDPDGDAVTFKWDVDGNSKADRSGASVAIPWGVLAPGVKNGKARPVTLRVRDQHGEQVFQVKLAISGTATLRKGRLTVPGTPANDVMRVSAAKGKIVVKQNGFASVFSAKSIREIHIIGGSGNDKLHVQAVSPKVQVSMWGGRGSDR